MKTLTGNIWDFFAAERKKELVIVIPTNRTVKLDGELVMGAGLAKQAKLLYPELPRHFATDDIYCLGDGRELFAAPTKDHYSNPSSERLIRNACLSIKKYAWDNPGKEFLVPLLGAGLGGVKSNLAKKVITEVLGPLKNVTLVLSPAS